MADLQMFTEFSEFGKIVSKHVVFILAPIVSVTRNCLSWEIGTSVEMAIEA